MAADLAAMETSAEQRRAIIGQFGHEQLLLELVTEPHEDGHELAKWFVATFPDEAIRRQMSTFLDRVFENEANAPRIPPGTVANVVIFGGHPQDASKMERHFVNSRFHVRWEICDKTSDNKTILDAMTSANLVILVTSMVSHNVMLAARRHAHKLGIDFCTVAKATETQLGKVLRDYFGQDERLAKPE